MWGIPNRSRGRDAARRRWCRAVWAGLCLAGVAQAHAPPAASPGDAVAAALRAHVAVLASDEFGGREPGTIGEARTLRYIARQFFDLGLVSGTNDPGHPWFAPVDVIARAPATSTAWFRRGSRQLAVPQSDMLVLTSGQRALVEGAPLYFVGRGAGLPPPRTELAGRIVLLLDGTADKPAAPPPGSAGTSGEGPGVNARQNALLAAGASAVLTVLDGDRTIATVAARRWREAYALAGAPLGGDLEAFVSAPAMDRLMAWSGGSLAALEHEAERPDFAPHLLDLSASLEATTREHVIHTHNVIARLPGRDRKAGAVLVLAHWDHFGTCARLPAPHLICNGAIDNASGVAAMIEIARQITHPDGASPAHPPLLDRDVYFLATTAEEKGLLGAEAFAENPPLPLGDVVAAFNLDSVAIAPAGSAVGVVGWGKTSLDAGIAQVARDIGVKLNPAPWPNDYIRRQDGWALIAHDVPAVMASTAYGAPEPLLRFFDGDYHKPGDVLKPGVEFGGAVQDVAFNAALVRWFADARHEPLPADH